MSNVENASVVERQPLISYVRDFSRGFGEPVAVVVGLPCGRFGVAIAPYNKPFDKQMLIKIACGRAERSVVNVHDGVAYPAKCPNRYVYLNDCHMHIGDAVDVEVGKMKERAAKYYKA